MSKKANFHEKLELHDGIKIGSNRSFGIVFAIFFAILGIITKNDTSTSFFILSVIFFITSLITPGILRPLNFLWFKFGLLLSKIVSPIILGILFFVVFTPMALLFRIMGKDPLRLKIEKNASTYWINRADDEPKASSMINQF